MRRLEGKVAIVTGTSPNIGGTLAMGMAAEGACIVCTDLSAEVCGDCAEKIVAAGSDAVAVPGDVTESGHADEAVESALSRWGRVDVLVNNAVFFDQRGIESMDYDAYLRQLQVILGGAFLFTRAAARAMVSSGRGGSIVNVLSTAAFQGQPGNIGYATGKSGLLNFTRSAAMEYAAHGIRVNGFTPTATAPTDPAAIAQMNDLIDRPQEYRMNFAAQLPMSRLPSPADYVGAVVFLASDDAAMITGTNITVDGGATAKYWPWQPHGTAGDL